MIQDRENLLVELTGMSITNRELTIDLTKRHNTVQLTLLVLTTVMAGTLWSLVLSSYEFLAAWIGAVISTVIAILSGLQERAQGPKKRLKLSSDIQKEIDECIIDVRHDEDLDMKEYDKRRKNLHGRLHVLKWSGRNLKKLTLRERQEYEMGWPQ